MKYMGIICLAFLPLWGFEADELEAKLFAVHATHILPKEGVLRAGFGGIGQKMNGLPLTLFPERCTVHFALGELVRPLHDAISWEECPYAVIIPLADLTPQLINLNCYDTFVIGDVALSERATLVIPNDQAITPCDAKIFPYDPTTTTLRQAVDILIAEQQGFAIRMSADDEEEMQTALLDGQNVNTPDFFAPLVQKYPYMVVGNRYSMEDEDSPGPHLLGELEGSFIGLTMLYLPLGETPKPLSTKKLFQTRERLITQLERELLNYLNSLPISYVFTKTFNIYSYQLWLEITKKDLEIRKKDARTLMQAPPFIWQEIGQINLKGNIALELSRIVDKYKNDLPLFKQ